ncbi:MAG: DDE-type integrase/transposase/recombinase, partial [Gemmatimonadales bacterium]
MLGNRSRPRIPLPKQWPSRVRSGVLHAISLAHFSLTFTRSWAANSINARIRLKQENDRLRQELALLREEMRIKDSRMLRITAQRRPHYPPTERLAILELRAARGWSRSQTARHLLVTTATVCSWIGRLDEEGPRAIVQTREPVNKFPEFVAYIVRRLKVLCPSMGKAKIAQILCRAGLHLGSTTVQRMLLNRPRPRPKLMSSPFHGVVTAKRPDHVWHCDLTTVPTSLGLWTSWFPFTLPQRWPYCWWVAVVVDHYSRRVMGFAVFEQQPTSVAVRTFLGRAMRAAGVTPRHLITDQGKQFTDVGFGRWCVRRGIRQRFGAVGKYGSIAIVERLIRTLKNECTRWLLVSYRREDFRRELTLYADWYNGYRPHDSLETRTPDEIYFDRAPACRARRFEPRRYWPRGSPCAGPQA